MYIKLRKVFVHTSLNHPVPYVFKTIIHLALQTLYKTQINVKNLILIKNNI